MRISAMWLVCTSVSLCAHLSSTLSAKLYHSISQTHFGISENALISSETRSYAESLLKRRDSPGLSLAAVRRDSSEPSGWRHEFASFGIAKAGGSPVTPDSVFAIASNSKLFLAVSNGLLIHNNSLSDLQGRRLNWQTKMKDLIPGWSLMDKDAEVGSTIQDLLSHRTGMPKHEFSYKLKDGLLDNMISTFRYLRPSAEFRETFQYNNMMYSVLSYLPHILLNQSYSSYVSEHIFGPLNMAASTFSIAQAERSGCFVDGFQYDLVDTSNGKRGIKKPTLPFFMRPGDEEIMDGPGGVLTSARDLVMWASMLLNEGKHPYTNASIVPNKVIEHLAHGRSVSDGGKPGFPELGPKVYGAGQFRFSYRGREIVEHGGSVPGYKTKIARLPNDNLAIISMSNDENGYYLAESIKWRVIDDVLGLEKIDWSRRYEKVWNNTLEKAQKHTPRPKHPNVPKASLVSLANHSFGHPTYGNLKPCFVPGSALPLLEDSLSLPERSHCANFLALPPTQRLLAETDLTSPTFLIPHEVGFATHLLLRHFNGNVFNLTVVWTNWAVREQHRFKHELPGLYSSQDQSFEGDQGDLITRWPETFEVEWVDNSEGEYGLAFRGGFWGKEGPDSSSPGGTGRDGAEVWFGKVKKE
ncbi:beta-lactamase/transpeptidase-like protein [Crepidotus variabilis]|uniref:Beta-lactamase/transpeptidase-like protein n=1 Tax=Crepidotus variabilis TaxID=179855 RepID=A0A9P6JKS6_9AGAR|nr:beta-lactamase/transpeptidase-like protein [Crepidotus variabilis]